MAMIVSPRRNWHTALVLAGLAMSWGGQIQSAPVVLPNASFELPATGYASPNIDYWQKSAKPDWYVEGGGFLWSQLTGAFRNQPPIDPTHIDNCDGNQAMWLFAVPEVGLSLDYNSMDWNDTAPSHAFDARYEVGSAYRLSVGVIGGGGAMLEGVTLELSLYYRDDLSNRVTVAKTSITNSAGLFPNFTHFVDFRLEVAPVKPTDAWANRHIGVQLLSTVTTNLQGGYWDLDNVRLESLQGPKLVASSPSNHQIALTWESDPGLRFEVFAATNVAQQSSQWVSLGLVTNTSGTANFVDTNASLGGRYYRALQLP